MTKAELLEEKHPTEPEANAAILHKGVHIRIEYNQSTGFTQVKEVELRIKFYNPEGYEFATQNIITYKSDNDQEKVVGIKGVTFNLEGDKILETKLRGDEIFKTSLSKFRDEVKFTLPNLKPKSVIDVTYEIRSPFFTKVDDLDLQFGIPIKKLNVELRFPEYFIFKPMQKGYYPYTIKNSSSNSSLSLSSKQSNGFGKGNSVNYDRIDFQVNHFSIVERDVPSMKEEPYVDNIHNYRAGLTMELLSVQFPQQPIKYYSQTWTDVVKIIYDNDGFGGELKQRGFFEDELNAILEKATSPNEKMVMVLNFVKSKIKWNQYYGKFSEEGVKSAYRKGVGNVADINLALVIMLRHAGFNANPVLVSTRSNGIPMFPTLDGFNYVVAAAEVNDKVLLMDGSDLHSTLDILPLRAINWNGRLVRKDGSSVEIPLIPQSTSQEMHMVNAKIMASGKIEGEVKSRFVNHGAHYFRNSHKGSVEEQVQKLENKFKNIEVENYMAENLGHEHMPVVESYLFELDGNVETLGEELYFYPFMMFRTKENIFKSNKREFPINFGYPSKNRFVFSMDIPEGYVVSSLPEPISISLPDNMATYKFNLLVQGSKLQLSVALDIIESLIPSLYYEETKSFYSMIVDKESERVVLKKG